MHSRFAEQIALAPGAHLPWRAVPGSVRQVRVSRPTGSRSNFVKRVALRRGGLDTSREERAGLLDHRFPIKIHIEIHLSAHP